MCFHSKQSKEATEVENRFDAKIDNIAIFNWNDNIAHSIDAEGIMIDASWNSGSFTNLWGQELTWMQNFGGVYTNICFMLVMFHSIVFS